MSNTPFEDLGEQIKKSVQSAVNTGDFSDFKEIGTAAGQAVKDFSKTFISNIETRGSTPQDIATRQPYEPEVVYPKQEKNQQNFSAENILQSMFGQAKQKKRKNPFGISSIIGSTAGILVFAILFVAFGIVSIFTAGQSTLFLALLSGVGLLGSLMGFLSSTGKRRFGRRINDYYTVLEKNNVLTIEELAFKSGTAIETVKKDMRKIIGKGLMPEVQFNGDIIFYGEEAYNEHLQSEELRRKQELEELEKQKRMQNPVTAEIEKFKLDGANLLKSIGQIKQSIQNNEMKIKIDALEKTIAKIFAYVEENPDKIQDTRKLVAYYLPTLFKLLSEYEKYEVKGLQSENVQKAKADIAQTVDTANVAFENLLEDLYKEDTLDIKTDIKVFNTMLKQEGLTEKEFDLNK